MTKTISISRRRGHAFRYGLPEILSSGVLILGALLVLFPLFLPWLFVFKTQLEYAYSPWSLPNALLWNNFAEAWRTIDIGRGLRNTLAVSLATILCTIPPSALAGYVFARYKSRITEVLFYLIFLGYFVPIQMVLIPLFKFNITVGLSNTLAGLFLPLATFAIPFWTMIYRSFFQGLPNDLADAARIDGAGHWNTFLRVMLPLAAPATVLALILVFIGAWSDYFLSLIMLNDQKLFTMQLRVAQFLNAYGTDRMPRYAAAALISAAPTVILYVLGHRWIIRGTLAGALKE